MHFFHGRRHAHEGFGHARHAIRHLMRGGRRHRLFDQGDLRLVILKLISERPRHGYELIKEIEEQLAGAYSPSPGVVYPTLTLLEELGYASVRDSDGKKLYELTDAGKEFLAANEATVNLVFDRMKEVGGGHGGLRALQIMRATKNLRSALRLRLARGALTDDQVKAMVAAIDEAAAKIGQI